MTSVEAEARKLLFKAVKKDCVESVSELIRFYGLTNGKVESSPVFEHLQTPEKISICRHLLYEALFIASFSGNEEIVVALIAAGATPNSSENFYTCQFQNIMRYYKTHDFGPSPLFAACSQGHLGIVKHLLRHGAKIDCPRPKDKYRPLHIAAELDFEPVVSLLLNNNADPNVKTIDDTTPLHLAAEKGNLTIAKQLLNRSANINAQTGKGSTALHLCLKNRFNDLAVIKILLERGACVNIQDKNNENALSLAIESKQPDFISSVLEYKPHISKKVLESITHILCSNRCTNKCMENEYEWINNVIEYCVTINPEICLYANIFLSAVEKGWVKVVKTLLINYSNPNGERIDPDLLHYAVINRQKEIVELLLTSGWNINGKNSCGKTPIEYSVYVDEEGTSFEIVKLLLDAGADVKDHPQLLDAIIKTWNEVRQALIADAVDNLITFDNEGKPIFPRIAFALKNYIRDINADNKIQPLSNSPLYLAIYNKVVEVIEILLKRKVAMNFERGVEVPLHEAVTGGSEKIIRLFIESGADVNSRNQYGETPLLLAIQSCVKIYEFFLQNEKAYMHFKFKDYGLVWDALYQFILTQGMEEIVVLLVEFGADLNSYDRNGETPLHLAVQGMRLKVCEVLLMNKAKLNLKNEKHQTPLHYAVIRGSEKRTRLLIEFGADVNAHDQYDKTPLHFAVCFNHFSIIKLLLSRKADVNFSSMVYPHCTSLRNTGTVKQPLCF